MENQSSRRKMLKQLGLGSLALSGIESLSSFTGKETGRKKKLKGNVNHSVCYWTYNFVPLAELCLQVKKIGFGAIDLVGPKDWPILKEHGIYSSMCNGAEISIPNGWNDKQFHSTLIKNYLDHIEMASKAGYKNIICFSGNTRGKDLEVGMNTCAEGLKQIMSAAEKAGITITMELLNSKVNHRDYMCDKSAWGVALCKKIGSPNFNLLYDIYHMQIDEGDVIRTINDNHQYFGHYHTGGVPGRHVIDESQELYYPAIVQAILKTGYKGYLAQEFLPTSAEPTDKAKQAKDKFAQLHKSVHICDV
jgi:hydroxypyruvate isomerase